MFKILSLTFFSLLALAANSVLCRLALGDSSIDPVSFTLIRLVSGILMLSLVLLFLRRSQPKPAAVSRPLALRYGAAFMLFLYAICFSVAYIDLDTGTGALILFGAVQLTMILYGLVKGQRLHRVEWLGLLMAFSGLVYLVLPKLSTPSFWGFCLMALAGMAWGFYTLMGRGSATPMVDTAFNFIYTWPWLLLLLLWPVLNEVTLQPKGVALAVMSGAVTSGLGYILWYATLQYYSATQAAVLQLLVPILAAFGGVILVAEAIRLNLMIASVLVLGGIFMVIAGRWWFSRKAKVA